MSFESGAGKEACWSFLRFEPRTENNLDQRRKVGSSECKGQRKHAGATWWWRTNEGPQTDMQRLVLFGSRGSIVNRHSGHSGRIKEALNLINAYEAPVKTRIQSSVSVELFLVISSDCVFLSRCQWARQLSAVRCILCPIVFHDGRALLSSNWQADKLLIVTGWPWTVQRVHPFSRRSWSWGFPRCGVSDCSDRTFGRWSSFGKRKCGLIRVRILIVLRGDRKRLCCRFDGFNSNWCSRRWIASPHRAGVSIIVAIRWHLD